MVESKEGKGELGWVAQPGRVMPRVVAGASFETNWWNLARTEGEVVDELGECGERPSREE